MTAVAKLHVGVIFIAYNAEKTLRALHSELPKGVFSSMLLVDDASSDRTFELARELGIPCSRNPANLGYGGNLKKALSLALESGMDVIADIHPDGEYDPSAIHGALAQIHEGADLVFGNRFTSLGDPIRAGMFLWKTGPILFLNWLSRRALRAELTDIHQGFRVYRASALRRLDWKDFSDDFLFSFELIAQAAWRGLRLAQVPVRCRYSGRKRGALLSHCIRYTLGVFKVLGALLLARQGIPSRLFRKG